MREWAKVRSSSDSELDDENWKREEYFVLYVDYEEFQVFRSEWDLIAQNPPNVLKSQIWTGFIPQMGLKAK